MNMYESEMLTTFTGKTFKEAIALLKDKLPPDAYSKVEGTAADLTDINPGYMIEKVTEAFGPAGIGWRYEWPPEALELRPDAMGTKDGWTCVIRRFELRLMMSSQGVEGIDAGTGWSEPILSTGASLNLRPEHALKGAVTNALSGAFSRLCWQVDVFKGLVSHRDPKPAKPAKPAKTPETPINDLRPWDPETLRKKIEQIASAAPLKAVSAETRGLLAGVMNRIDGSPEADAARRGVLQFLFGHGSLKNLPHKQASALNAWIKPSKNDDQSWSASEMAAAEFRQITLHPDFAPINKGESDV